MSDSHVDSNPKEQGMEGYVSLSVSGKGRFTRCTCEGDRPSMDYDEWPDECMHCARKRSLRSILGALNAVADLIDHAVELDEESKRQFLTKLRWLNSLSEVVIRDAVFGPRAPGQDHWNSRPVASPVNCRGIHEC